MSVMNALKGESFWNLVALKHSMVDVKQIKLLDHKVARHRAFDRRLVSEFKAWRAFALSQHSDTTSLGASP